MSSVRRSNSRSVSNDRESTDKSALDVYRQWLDEASSGSDSDDEASTSTQARPAMDITRATPLQSPENTKDILKPISSPNEPKMISPRQQLHPRTNGSAPPTKPNRPRKLMQMSFRSILSPSPQIPVAQREVRPRSTSRQASLGTLFSDAWIAQPQRARRPSRVARSGHASMHDVPLDNAEPPSGSSSDTANEKPRMDKRRSSSWEFHQLDSTRGWWVVLWAFLACFVSLSTLINYPVYEAYYMNTSRDETLVDINQGQDTARQVPVVSTYVVLIGTLMSGFAALGSLGAGIASDVLGMRTCALVGTATLCVGLLASSFIDKLWALCITHGVVCGTGIAMLALPAYTAPTHWFDKHRALSTGIAVSGTGLGVLALAPAYRAILHHQGLAICLYVQAIVTLACGTASALGLRNRIDLQGPSGRMKWRVLKDARIWALMMMALLASCARFAQLLCLPMFARSSGVANDAAGVLYATGASLLVGMVCGGFVADSTGYIAGIGLSELILGLFTLVLYTPSTSPAPMHVFAVVFGLTTGTLAAVLPASIAQMFGTPRVASTTGLVLAACAPALLATTPAALKFMHLLEEGKTVAWLSAISGVFSVLAGCIGMMLPVLQRRYVRMFTKRESAIAW
ncbi:hypothetical protein GGH96_001282 [Coemansia sp. RSA 1972]|nr:hypothetical protein GGH96_001282 [Coemansia sp. RSA 1972]